MEENQETRTEETKNRRKKSKGKILGIIMILEFIILIVISILSLKSNKNKIYTIPDTNIELEISQTQDLYATKEEITEKFGEEEAEYYNFIIKDKVSDQYDIYGQLIEKSQYEGYDIDAIIQADREYYKKYITNDLISEVSDITLNDKKIKTYNYSYEGNDGNQYKAIIYLYEADTHYLWLNVYINPDVEIDEANNIIKTLIK